MSVLLRIASGKGGAPATHATVTVPENFRTGSHDRSLALQSVVDGSEGTVPIPPDALPGQRLHVVVPSAYPNWGPSPSSYAGDWVAKYDGGAHAPGRGTWATERVPPRTYADPGFVQRQGLIDGGDGQNGGAERFRQAAQRRDAAQTAAAQRQQEHHSVRASSPSSSTASSRATREARGEFLERAAEAVRLHEALVEAGGIGGAAAPPMPPPGKPGRAAIGAPESVVAAVERLRSASALDAELRREAVAELRFVCRQNVRAVERANQTAAGDAGAPELLCSLLDAADVTVAGRSTGVAAEERVAMTWLLAQLCFKHRGNCERLVSCRGSLEIVVGQIVPAHGNRKVEGGSGLVLCVANESGLRGASFGLLCNVASYADDDAAESIVDAGGIGAALAMLAALDSSGALHSQFADRPLERTNSDDRGDVTSLAQRMATRDVQVTTAYDGPEVDLGLALQAVLLLGNLATCERCRAAVAGSGAVKVLRPLATLSGMSTSEMPDQRVPNPGGSLGAAAARVLAEIG